LSFPVTRSAKSSGLRPDPIPMASGTPAAKQSASARNVKLLEQRDQAASAMLRSLLSSPPPAVAAGAGAWQEAAPVHEEVLFADTGGRDFGGDNETDWTGTNVINAFRPNASRINDELPDYFTFYALDAVRDEGDYFDSKSQYKNGTVTTAHGNYSTPYEFATALRKSIVVTCGSELSKGVGTPTYEPRDSYGVEVFAWDPNTAVGIGGPKPDSSIGLNTILTGCVRLAFEAMTALPRPKDDGISEGAGGSWADNNKEWIVALSLLGVLAGACAFGICWKVKPCSKPAERLVEDPAEDLREFMEAERNNVAAQQPAAQRALAHAQQIAARPVARAAEPAAEPNAELNAALFVQPAAGDLPNQIPEVDILAGDIPVAPPLPFQ